MSREAQVCTELLLQYLAFPMERVRSRSRGRRKGLVLRPAVSCTLHDFLKCLHRLGAPALLVQMVYHLLIIYPVAAADLVDSLEVFAGDAMYSQVFGAFYRGPVLSLTVVLR